MIMGGGAALALIGGYVSVVLTWTRPNHHGHAATIIAVIVLTLVLRRLIGLGFIRYPNYPKGK